MNKIYLLLAPAILILAGCKAQVDEKANGFDLFVEKAQQVSPGTKKMSDVVQLIQLSGAKYNPMAPNTTGQVEQYKIHPLKAALNCGSYTADALYHRSFNNSDSAFESYTAAQILANHLEFGPFYVENLIKARKEGMDESDSLWIKFDGVLQQVDSSLSQQERFHIKIAFLAGNSLEKLYLVNALVSSIDTINEPSPEAYKLLYVLINRENAIKSLIELIESYNVATESPIFAEIQKLHKLYLQIDLNQMKSYADYKTFYMSETHKAISAQLTKIHELIIAI